jgi:TRAP-type mannitol/chloroaromatic compound transport system permease small subunit
MKALRDFAAAIEAINDRIGQGLAILVWTTAVTCAVVVFLRYVMYVSFVWMQELYVWIHAVVFMVGAGYAMRRDAHVRVDIFYRNWSARTRALVDIFGTLVFTLPWVIVLGWLAWPYIRASWAIMEGASQAGGLAYTYLLKTVVIVFCLVVGLQGLAIIARGILALRGEEPSYPVEPPPPAGS